MKDSVDSQKGWNLDSYSIIPSNRGFPLSSGLFIIHETSLNLHLVSSRLLRSYVLEMFTLHRNQARYDESSFFPHYSHFNFQVSQRPFKDKTK